MIIPALNCQEFDEVKERFHIAQEILFGAGSESHQVGERDGWIHLDVADGSFTPGYSTWRNAAEFKTLQRNPLLKVEVHLMMTSPEEAISQWLSAGVDRIIFHLEAAANVEVITNLCSESGVQSMLALKPETPVAHAEPYLALVDGLQLLAVSPGPSAQKMAVDTLQRIKDVRRIYPALRIEVDGGITPETAKMCLTVGANQLVSSSYIFLDDNPAAAYQRLNMI